MARALEPALTKTERKRRGEKSAVIVERLVRLQLRAMGCERFDVGIKRDAGEMILREGQGAIEIEETIKWLRHENAKGAQIYVRPTGAHGLSLLDDLSSEAMERMKAEGFEPAVVVETSPNNFQAWLPTARFSTPRRARVPRSNSLNALAGIHRALIGGTLVGLPGSLIQSPSANYHQECNHSRGCARPRDVLTRKRRRSSPPSDQAMRVKNGRVGSRRNGTPACWALCG